MIVVTAVAVMLSARSAPHSLSAATQEHMQAQTIPGYGPMPQWLADGNETAQTEYVWAAQHFDELQYIPCYCGCGPESQFGHTNNFACYFDLDANGAITGLDSHGFG